MTLPAAAIPDHVPPDRVVDFDMFADDALLKDVHEGYLQLQARAPDFFYTPRNGGHWVAIRQQEVFDITHDVETFTSFRPGIPRPDPKAQLPRIIPVDMDPPEHAEYRKVLAPMFSPGAVAKLQDQARALTVELIAALDGKRETEFVAAVAMPMPVKLFMQMMGMDLSRFEEFVGWVDDSFNATDTNKRTMVYMKIMGYLMQLVKARQVQPGDDVVSKLLAAEVNGNKLPFDVVMSMCLLLFIAGLDTVTNAMAFIVRALALDPARQDQLRKNPAQIPEAVEEYLRRYAFANAIRMVKKDAVYKGITIKQGEPVLICLPMVGLDERFVTKPTQVDFDRDVKQHYAFGSGAHRCAGSSLARSELKVFLEEWLTRMPPFRLKEGSKPVFRPGIVMGITQLEIVW